MSLLYRDRMKQMKTDPQWMERSFAERSSAIGREWREMSPEEQAPWKQKASEARAEFKLEKRNSRKLAAGGAHQELRLPVISSVQSCAPVMQILQTGNNHLNNHSSITEMRFQTFCLSISEGQSQPRVHPRIGPTQIDGRRTVNRTPFQVRISPLAKFWITVNSRISETRNRVKSRNIYWRIKRVNNQIYLLR